MIRVYFDGKCSLCKKEIAYYKSIAPINTFVWKDIATEPKHLKEINVSQSIALKRLHVLDDRNKLIVGFNAFIVIWRKMRWWKLIAMLASLPLVNHFLNISYNWFADWKFSKSSHCTFSSN